MGRADDGAGGVVEDRHRVDPELAQAVVDTNLVTKGWVSREVDEAVRDPV
jgi:hypothetical protein